MVVNRNALFIQFASLYDYMYILHICGSLVTPDTVNIPQPNIDGLMQKRRNSIANALELRPFCIKPSI